MMRTGWRGRLKLTPPEEGCFQLALCICWQTDSLIYYCVIYLLWGELPRQEGGSPVASCECLSTKLLSYKAAALAIAETS